MNTKIEQEIVQFVKSSEELKKTDCVWQRHYHFFRMVYAYSSYIDILEMVKLSTRKHQELYANNN